MATYEMMNTSVCQTLRVRHEERDASGEWKQTDVDVLVPPGDWFQVEVEAGKRRAEISEAA